MAISGQKAAAKLEKGIGNIKNILFCLNVVSWICGAIIFALCLWIRFDNEVQDWVDKLEINYFYIGVYILLIGSFLVLLIAFLGCTSALTENPTLLLINTAAQMVCFLVGLAGAAILKDFSTFESALQPGMRRVMLRLISYYPTDSEANFIVRSIQENIGCCGADGPNDYINMKKPLPSECRDSVTGNVYFYGCVDEMTWLLEDRTAWACNIALALCFMHIINAVLSFSLLQAVKKQDEVIAMYNR